jgi:hypothetical protein
MPRVSSKRQRAAADDSSDDYEPTGRAAAVKKRARTKTRPPTAGTVFVLPGTAAMFVECDGRSVRALMRLRTDVLAAAARLERRGADAAERGATALGVPTWSASMSHEHDSRMAENAGDETVFNGVSPCPRWFEGLAQRERPAEDTPESLTDAEVQLELVNAGRRATNTVALGTWFLVLAKAASTEVAEAAELLFPDEGLEVHWMSSP